MKTCTSALDSRQALAHALDSSGTLVAREETGAAPTGIAGRSLECAKDERHQEREIELSRPNTLDVDQWIDIVSRHCGLVLDSDEQRRRIGRKLAGVNAFVIRQDIDRLLVEPAFPRPVYGKWNAFLDRLLSLANKQEGEAGSSIRDLRPRFFLHEHTTTFVIFSLDQALALAREGRHVIPIGWLPGSLPDELEPAEPEYEEQEGRTMERARAGAEAVPVAGVRTWAKELGRCWEVPA